MILADTSVWVRHFRVNLPKLGSLLETGQISIHPVVIGELAMGNLAGRAATLATLRTLPLTKVGTYEECLDFVETHSLSGKGIGWNDVQLLAAARLSGNRLWTLDARLSLAAAKMGLEYLI